LEDINMQATAALKRWLAVAITGAVFFVVLVLTSGDRTAPVQGKDEKAKGAAGDWPLY